MVATLNTDNKSTTKFDYTMLAVSDLKVETSENAKTGRVTVDNVIVQDEPIKPSGRFWTSLYARYGFNGSIFKYFTHAEVFERIAEKEANDRMRLCIERTDNGSGTPVNRLLAVSNPNRPLVVHDELQDLLGRNNAENISYSDGIVESTHMPRIGGNTFDISGDEFSNRFVMSTPIDGYGAPNIYLSLLRLICQNGMVGMSKVFRSSLTLGKGEDDVSPTLIRALDGFNSDDGYAALRQRMEAASNSWASVYESQKLYGLLVRLYGKNLVSDLGGTTPGGAKMINDLVNRPEDGFGEQQEAEEQVGSQMLIGFHRMTGDVSQLYGLANIDALSQKRQRTLPVKCTVYDLLNFATEAATHYAKPAGSRDLQAFVGSIISGEYDMENTKDGFSDFADFHIDRKLAAGVTGSAPSASEIAKLN